MFKTKDVIAVSCAAHRFNGGFLSKDSIRFDKKAEGKRANSDLLYAHFLDPKDLKFKNALPKLKVIKEDLAMADDVIDYLKGLSFKAIERKLTDFESNVLSVVNSEHIDKTQLGITSSLPKVYFNKIEQDNWTDRELELSRTSNELGELHTRGTFDAKVEFVRYIPRTMSYLITCSVKDQHILKFFHAKNIKLESQIRVDGYIKSQGKGKFHNGIETIINRIKIHEDVS
jgi:hypothetical protein